MRRKICFVLGGVLLALSSSLLATPTIKVALIRVFGSHPYTSTRYKSYFDQGLETASAYAKQHGIKIDIKRFSYAKHDILSILKAAKAAKAWKPSLVIGPNYSKKFLLLKPFFQHTLVLSPYATSSKLSKLPKNFASLVPTNQYSAAAIYHFTQKKFPDANLFLVTQLDCENCVDLSHQITLKYNKHHRASEKLYHLNFFRQNVYNLSLGVFKHFKKNDVAILSTTGFVSAMLMKNIVNKTQLSVPFVGSDSWGSWRDNIVARLPADKSYKAYRVVPLSIQAAGPRYKEFKKLYESIYQHAPLDNISYAVFLTMQVPINLLINNPQTTTANIVKPENLLALFLAKMKKMPHWFWPTQYHVILMTLKQHKVIGSIAFKK